MLSAFLAFFLSNPTLLAIVGGIVAALGWGFKQRRAGAAAERAKQAAKNAKARDIADEIDDAISGRSAEKNREELGKWSAR